MRMRTALIGHTGFVGGNLLQQLPFDDLYNSSNIEDIGGRTYDVVYCAGAPGVKWKANREPEHDLAAIARLSAALGGCRCGHVVLLSTIDVYPRPLNVDEATAIDIEQLTPYGRHRLVLEQFVQQHFSSTIIRLPALFGPGLRKNVIYDFLHGNQLQSINPASAFQFYDIRCLGIDSAKIRDIGLPLVNFATEPVSVVEVAREAFSFEFKNLQPPPAQTYDMRTRHNALLGGAGGYLTDRATTLARLADFVRSTDWRPR